MRLPRSCRAVLLLVGLSFAGCPRTPPEPKREHVVVGVSLLRISQPVFVAVERGLFKARGLDVELKRYDTAQPLADELAAGRLDAAGYVAYPILFSREGKPPPVRLATAMVEDDAHPISFLLVKRDSPLSAIADLKGKTMGHLPTLAYKRWLEAILAKHGLAVSDVTLMPLAPPMQVDALASGGVDALFTGDPMATAALARDVARRLTDRAEVPHAVGGAPFLFGTFALSESLATTRPSVASALVGALDEAITLMAADDTVGREAMTPYVREAERPFVSKYAPSRYLRAAEVEAAALEATLARETAPKRAVEVQWAPN